MDDLLDFFLHLAFAGFTFLCLVYVLRVFFFMSPRELPPVSGEHQAVGERKAGDPSRRSHA